MSVNAPEVELKEAFNWYHQELYDNPPYSHYDMVYALERGFFMIEDKQSGWEHAQAFAERYAHRKDVWTALSELAHEGPAIEAVVY